MSYLLPNDLSKILEDSFNLTPDELQDFLTAKLHDNIKDNPKFIERLGKSISDLEASLENAKKDRAARKSRIESESKGAVYTDFLSTMDWEREKFPYLNGRVYDQRLIVGVPYIKPEKIRVLKEQYELFKNDMKKQPEPVNKGIKTKLKWKGELKEFAELIDQLEKNKWIEVNHGELKPTVETLCSCFDFSATKKKEDSNSVNSLSQYLKPSEREDKIYTKRYTKKFNSILPKT